MAPSRPVVAVLPFTTPAGRLVELADGLAAGILDQLSIARFWVVLGRGASFAYRDRANPARAMRQEQGATFVVTGTLEQSAERLRDSAGLVDAATGQQLWAERFDRPSSTWAAVRDDLRARIGSAVYDDAVFPTILNRASERPLDDLGANEPAVLAREQSQKVTREANARGLELATLALVRAIPAPVRRYTFVAGSTASRSIRGLRRKPKPCGAGARRRRRWST